MTRPADISEGPVCEKCGQQHLTKNGLPSCSGHIVAGERKGQPCRHEPGWSTNHPGVGRCRKHGGSTPSHNRSAQMEIARRECERLGVMVETDPAEALITAVWRAQGNLAYYEAQVNELDSLTQIETGQGGEKVTVHPIVALYHEAEKWAANVAVAALRAGVEERRVRMAERDSAQIIQAQVAALTALGLGDRLDDFRIQFVAALDGSARPALDAGGTAETVVV